MQTSSRYLKLVSAGLAVVLASATWGGTPAVGAAATAAISPQVGITLYVSPVGNNDNDCITTTTPCATIDGALARSVSDSDTIRVTASTFTSTVPNGVMVTKTITILGGWTNDFGLQYAQTTLDGQNARRVLTVSSAVTGEVTLGNFVIRNGQGTGAQAGIFAQGPLAVRNTNFYNNANGLLVDGTSFTVTVRNSAFYSNTIGVFVNGAVAELRNVTVSGNTNKGIYNAGGAVFINNATIVNNGSGGGLEGTTTTTHMQNSILAGNTTDCAGSYTSNGFNVLSNFAGACTTPQVSDKTVTDPGVGPLKNNGGLTLSHLPFPASPALNAGSTSTPGGGGNACESTDQRGQSRPFGPRCDAGSWEYTSVIYFSYLALIRR